MHNATLVELELKEIEKSELKEISGSEFVTAFYRNSKIFNKLKELKLRLNDDQILKLMKLTNDEVYRKESIKKTDEVLTVLRKIENNTKSFCAKL